MITRNLFNFIDVKKGKCLLEIVIELINWSVTSLRPGLSIGRWVGWSEGRAVGRLVGLSLFDKRASSYTPYCCLSICLKKVLFPFCAEKKPFEKKTKY